VRILYFSDSYGPHDHRFLMQMAESGCEVAYLRRGPGRVVESRPLPDGVRLLPPLDPDGARPRRLGVALIDGLRRVLEDVDPDVLHAGPLQPCSWLAARAGFGSLVSMSWGSDLLQGGRFGLGRRQAETALRGSAAFIGDCEAVRRRAVELGMEASRTVIFPWGVDLEMFAPKDTSSARLRLGWLDALVVLCLRSWEPQYGVDTVVEAFLRAAGRESSLRLILAGDGSLRPSLIAAIESSGLADRIWLTGHVPYSELPMLYHTADVYVSASRSDGSSVSLLEAMACGLPSLVSDIPGNREWVRDGETGRGFPPGDIAALADLLRAMPGATRQRKEFGRQARRIAEERADWRRNGPRLMEAYAMALNPARERT
jgi:glycosyltransferase involved in cell wall biosynthesis